MLDTVNLKFSILKEDRFKSFHNFSEDQPYILAVKTTLFSTLICGKT